MLEPQKRPEVHVGVSDLLLVLFIYLKLTHQINWSWICVIAPFWIPSVITILYNLIVKLKAQKDAIKYADEKIDEAIKYSQKK